MSSYVLEADNPENRPEKRKTEDSEAVESKKARHDEAEILKRFQANSDCFMDDLDFKKDLLEILEKKKRRSEDAPKHSIHNLMGNGPPAQELVNQQILFMLGVISTQLNTQQNQLNDLKLGQDRVNAALPQLVAPVPQQLDPRLIHGAPGAHAPGAQMGLMGQGTISSPVTPRAPRPQFMLKRDEPRAQLNTLKLDPDWMNAALPQPVAPGAQVPQQLVHGAPGAQAQANAGFQGPMGHVVGAQMGQNLMGQGAISSPVTPRAPRPQFVIRRDVTPPLGRLMVPTRSVHQPAPIHAPPAPGPHRPQAPQGLTNGQVRGAHQPNAQAQQQAPKPVAPAQMMHHAPIQASPAPGPHRPQARQGLTNGQVHGAHQPIAQAHQAPIHAPPASGPPGISRQAPQGRAQSQGAQQQAPKPIAPVQMMHHVPPAPRPQAPHGQTPGQVPAAHQPIAPSQMLYQSLINSLAQGVVNGQDAHLTPGPPRFSPQPVPPAQMIHHTPGPPRLSPQAAQALTNGQDQNAPAQMVYQTLLQTLTQDLTQAPPPSKASKLQDPTAPWTLRLEAGFLESLNLRRSVSLSYSSLAAMAIHNSPHGFLDVKDICAFILFHYPSFPTARPNWTNSLCQELDKKSSKKPHLFVKFRGADASKDLFRFADGVTMEKCFGNQCWVYVLVKDARKACYYNEIMEGKDQFLAKMKRGEIPRPSENRNDNDK